jgi:hypothetical protein
VFEKKKNTAEGSYGVDNALVKCRVLVLRGTPAPAGGGGTVMETAPRREGTTAN